MASGAPKEAPGPSLPGCVEEVVVNQERVEGHAVLQQPSIVDGGPQRRAGRPTTSEHCGRRIPWKGGQFHYGQHRRWRIPAKGRQFHYGRASSTVDPSEGPAVPLRPSIVDGGSDRRASSSPTAGHRRRRIPAKGQQFHYGRASSTADPCEGPSIVDDGTQGRASSSTTAEHRRRWIPAKGR